MDPNVMELPPTATTGAIVDDGTEKSIVAYPRLYWAALIVLAGLWFIAGYYFSGVPNPEEGKEASTGNLPLGLNLGYLIWTFGALYFAAGIRIVNPNMLTGILVLGVPTEQISGGVAIVPAGLFELVEFTRGTVEFELPTEPEKIFRNEDAQEVPLGMKPPTRITFANGTDEAAKNDPLQQRITAEVPAFVRFRIEKLWDFYVRMGAAKDGWFEEAHRQLEDMVVSVLQEDLTKKTVAEALAEQDKTNEKLDDDVRRRTKNWGVEIIDVRMKLINLSHKLNSAITGIAQSRAEKQSKVITAEAQRDADFLAAEAAERKLVREGDGRASATKADFRARTEGLKAMAAELGLDANAILGAETARNIAASPSDKIIIGTDGFKDMVGMAAGVAKAFTKSETPPPTPREAP